MCSQWQPFFIYRIFCTKTFVKKSLLIELKRKLCFSSKSLSKPPLELTLAIIKPDVCKHPNRLNVRKLSFFDTNFEN